jgi:hypothetical protein
MTYRVSVVASTSRGISFDIAGTLCCAEAKVIIGELNKEGGKETVEQLKVTGCSKQPQAKYDG